MLFIRPSIEPIGMKNPSLAWYTHCIPLRLSDQIKSNLHAIVPPGKGQRTGLVPILGTRQARCGVSIEEWVGKAAASGVWRVQ